jgi:hypothetical protein
MRVDRIWPTAKNLWREQPRWRWTTIGAAAATVLALLGGGLSGGYKPPPSPPPPTPGGQIPTLPPVPSGSFDVAKRLRDFYQAYVNADADKAKEGLRCEKLVAALGVLAEGDDKSAKPVQQAAIADAKRCVPSIDESNKRVDALAAQVKAFKQSSTLAAAEAVDAAAAALTDFDRSRDLAAKGIALTDLDKLKAAAASYRQLLDRAATLAPLYRPRDPATLDTAVELAKLHRDAAAMPFAAPGLDAAQQDALNAAAGADEALAQSDRKIGVLQEAYARRAADPIGMTIALGALDAFDRARLQAAQTGLNLQEAEAAARTSVGQAIARVANDYTKAATYANATMLTQLAALAGSLKADVPADAKAVVARAQVDLDGSAKRLKALNDVAARWRDLRAQGARDAAVEARVGQVFAAIAPSGSVEPNSFDAAAMTPQDKAAFGTLVAAVIEVQGKLLPGQRRGVTIAVRGPTNADTRTNDFLSDLAAELQRLGFAVTQGGADATFVLNVASPSLSDAGINADGQYQRRASTAATMQWVYSGRTADLGTITAIGADRDNRAITDAALAAAAQAVGQRVLAKAQGD